MDAYNQKDLETFLSVYSESVEIRDFPSNELLYVGVEKMRIIYSKLFHENPNQHATLLERITNGNIVIDHEHVTGRANGLEVFAIAIYEVVNGKISKVWFKK
nr:nuclear transport factor 2 family protein [Evansella tamaricis]